MRVGSLSFNESVEGMAARDRCYDGATASHRSGVFLCVRLLSEPDSFILVEFLEEHN